MVMICEATMSIECQGAHKIGHNTIAPLHVVVNAVITVPEMHYINTLTLRQLPNNVNVPV